MSSGLYELYKAMASSITANASVDKLNNDELTAMAVIQGMLQRLGTDPQTLQAFLTSYLNDHKNGTGLLAVTSLVICQSVMRQLMTFQGQIDQLLQLSKSNSALADQFAKLSKTEVDEAAQLAAKASGEFSQVTALQAQLGALFSQQGQLQTLLSQLQGGSGSAAAAGVPAHYQNKSTSLSDLWHAVTHVLGGSSGGSSPAPASGPVGAVVGAVSGAVGAAAGAVGAGGSAASGVLGAIGGAIGGPLGAALGSLGTETLGMIQGIQSQLSGLQQQIEGLQGQISSLLRQGQTDSINSSKLSAQAQSDSMTSQQYAVQSASEASQAAALQKQQKSATSQLKDTYGPNSALAINATTSKDQTAAMAECILMFQQFLFQQVAAALAKTSPQTSQTALTQAV